jgi:hypothetical protein
MMAALTSPRPRKREQPARIINYSGMRGETAGHDNYCREKKTPKNGNRRFRIVESLLSEKKERLGTT